MMRIYMRILKSSDQKKSILMDRFLFDILKLKWNRNMKQIKTSFFIEEPVQHFEADWEIFIYRWKRIKNQSGVAVHHHLLFFWMKTSSILAGSVWMLMSTVLFQAPLRAKKVGYCSIFHFLHSCFPSYLSTLTTVTPCFSLKAAMLG